MASSDTEHFPHADIHAEDAEHDALPAPGLDLFLVSIDRDNDLFSRQSRTRGSKELPTIKPSYPYAASRYSSAEPSSSGPSIYPSEGASSAKKPITTQPTSYTPAKSKGNLSRSNSYISAAANDSNLDSNTDATSSGKSSKTDTLSVKYTGGAFPPGVESQRVSRRLKEEKKKSVDDEDRLEPRTKAPKEDVIIVGGPPSTSDVEVDRLLRASWSLVKFAFAADRLLRASWSFVKKFAFAAVLFFLVLAQLGLLMLACRTYGENPRGAKLLVSFGMVTIASIAFLLAFFAGRSPSECLLLLMAVFQLAILICMNIDTILPCLAGFLGPSPPKPLMY